MALMFRFGVFQLERLLQKIEEENGYPSTDVWFIGTTDPYNVSSSKGLLEQYEPKKNASHLISDKFQEHK